MDAVKQWFHEWSGTSKMNERMYQVIMKEFHVVLYLSCAFLDLRPQHRIYSVILLLSGIIVLTISLGCGIMTCILQRDDFTSFVLSFVLTTLIAFAILTVMLLNMNRKHLIELFRFMSIGFYDYNDNENVVEIAVEIEKSKKQRKLIMVFMTGYLSTAGIVGVLGRTMDIYAGVAHNSTYINGVYVMTPVPLWYPFEVSSGYWHHVALFSQVATSGLIAAFYAGLMYHITISLQNIILQFKILIFRIRKIHQFAFKLYIQRGGRKKNKLELYEDHDFQACSYEYLSKCAGHHVAILRSFHHLNSSCSAFVYVGVLVMSIFMAVSSFLLIVGGKPSVVSLGLVVLAVELLDGTIIIWQSDQVRTLADSLHEELYNIDWRLMDKRSCRTLMIMIERSKKRTCLESAISHTPLNWETFSAVLNSTYSLINILVAAKE